MTKQLYSLCCYLFSSCMKNILIYGASSYLAPGLMHYFLHKGYNIFCIGTKPSTAQDDCVWVEHLEELNKIPIHFVFNLSTESLWKKRWTKKRKIELVRYQVRSTKRLMEWIQLRQFKPERIITTSSINFYGICPHNKWASTFTERQHPQPFFVSKYYQLCENAALHTGLNTKVVRLGMVLDNTHGCFPKMLKPIQRNLYNQIGDGRHPLCWIHIEDVCRAFEYLMNIRTESNIFNLVAPNRINQETFSKACTQHFKKISCFSIPYWLIKMVHGEKSDLIINGQYCKPKALLDNYFEFKYCNLDDALNDLYPVQKNNVFRKIKNLKKTLKLKYQNILFNYFGYLFKIVGDKINKTNK